MSICICGHSGEKHAWTEPEVCMGEDVYGHDCKCIAYMGAQPGKPVRRDWDETLRKMDIVQDQIRWVLENLPYTRNFTNDEFTDFYKKHITYYDDDRVTQYDSIRRGKQKVVRDNPYKYGPTDKDLIHGKENKESGMFEWCTQ